MFSSEHCLGYSQNRVGDLACSWRTCSTLVKYGHTFVKGGNSISYQVHLICCHLGMMIFDCSLVWLCFQLEDVKLKDSVGH